MITSARHPLVLAFRRAEVHPRRGEAHRVLLDGPRLIADALDAGAAIEVALVAPGVAPHVATLASRIRASGARVHEATARIVQAASGVVTSQGLVALARPPESLHQRMLLLAPDLLLLVADGVQDPGNLGTMIRTAAAVGASAVALCGASADPWAPKALRATMGAAFRIPIARVEAAALRDRLAAGGAGVVVADPVAEQVYWEAPLDPPVALVIGSEGEGPDPAWASAGTRARIPLLGPVESLNAAVAAALLLYEVVRRRQMKPDRA
jgi:TrmH family RNA methyltransferase